MCLYYIFGRFKIECNFLFKVYKKLRYLWFIMLKLLPKKHKKRLWQAKIDRQSRFEYLLITAFAKAEKYFLNIRWKHIFSSYNIGVGFNCACLRFFAQQYFRRFWNRGVTHRKRILNNQCIYLSAFKHIYAVNIAVKAYAENLVILI